MVFLKFTVPNSCSKHDQENNTCPLSWLLIIVISSTFVYAVFSGFHLLSFLLSCSALLISTFSLPFLRPNSIASERSIETQMSISSVVKEEEVIVEERVDNDDSDDEDQDQDPTQECSDGSISDEESLIEIAIPSGYYIDSKKQEKWWSDCNSIQQQNLMAELITEINEFYEEENMIELDLSMGSIMCPRFEIKA